VCEVGIGDYIPGRVGRRIWENGPGGRKVRIRDYMYGCLFRWIGESERNACEGGIRDSIPGLLGWVIAENDTGKLEGRTRD
jgi:hypothetical protein